MATPDSTKDMMTQTTHAAKHNLLARESGQKPGLVGGGLMPGMFADGPEATI